jgi:hypothetical protein
MAPNMKHFDPEAICPKCGGDDIGVQYCGQGGKVYCTLPWHKPALIHRYCQRCHYDWSEVPLDAEET